MLHFRIWRLSKLGRTRFSKSGHSARAPRFTRPGPHQPQALRSIHMKHLPRKPRTAGQSPHWAVRRWASEDLWSLPPSSPSVSSFHVMKIYFPSIVNPETRELWESVLMLMLLLTFAFEILVGLLQLMSIEFLPWHSFSPIVHSVTIHLNSCLPEQLCYLEFSNDTFD